jgi:hypothetical protein
MCLSRIKKIAQFGAAFSFLILALTVRGQKLKEFYATGTVTHNGKIYKIVGGTVVNGRAMYWVRGKDITSEVVVLIKPLEVFQTISGENKSVGVVASHESDKITFEDALFLLYVSEERKIEPSFFFMLSPLSGAEWVGDVTEIKDNHIIDAMPDIHAFEYQDATGKCSFIRHPYYVSTTAHSLTTNTMVRLELVEFSDDRTMDDGSKCKRLMLAFKGLGSLSDFPAELNGGVALTYDPSFSKRMSLALTDDSGGSHYLTGQAIDEQGQPILLYEPNITLRIDKIRRAFGS